MLSEKSKGRMASASFREAGSTTRPFGRFSPTLGSIFTAAFFAVSVAASPAYADTGYVSVNFINPGSIEVANDGSIYTAPVIPLISLSANLQVQLDAEVSGRVKNWKAWLKVKTENGFWVQFSNNSYSKSYPVGGRPKTVNTAAAINIPYGTIAPYAAAQCNVLADTLRGQGLSDAAIFAQDRIIPISVDGALSYEMTGAAGTSTPEEVHDYKTFNLNCKAGQPTRVPPVANDPTRNIPDVEQASLTILEVSTLGGACKLNLSGVIVTKDANKQVKFRYKDDAGNQSDVKTVMTDHTKTVMFNHQYNLAGTGNKQGKIRIAIVDDNFSSPWSNYDVNCNPNAPGGLVQDNGVQTTDVARGAAGGFAPADPVNPDSNLPGTPALGKTAASGTAGPGAKKADLARPDLMATTLGMVVVHGPSPWGSTVALNNPSAATATGVGPNGNLCRFTPIAFRPFNKGTVPSGPFQVAVRRNNQPVHSANFNLAAQTGLPANSGWHTFTLELAQGPNTIKVEFDPSKSVDESDEGNNVYTMTVQVNFPCTAGGITTAPKAVAPTTTKPGPTEMILTPPASPSRKK
jgi:hypothetical protein